MHSVRSDTFSRLSNLNGGFNFTRKEEIRGDQGRRKATGRVKERKGWKRLRHSKELGIPLEMFGRDKP